VLLLVAAATATAIAVAAQPGVPTATAGAELGRWITESGNLEVEIAPCGDALCGTVTRVLANHSMSDSGKEMAAADSRSPLGTKLVYDLVASGDNQWRGQIYNRENGKTYRCIVSVEDANRLRVRGYVGIPWIGKTQIWTRVS
jgi:uncharacterized protein (DUF2147 family)